MNFTMSVMELDAVGNIRVELSLKGRKVLLGLVYRC